MEHTDDSVVYIVKNSKVMPENIKLQVFQRYFSTKGAGRGIGTYSMKLITENFLGGKVTMESEKKSGTVFRVEIPLNGVNKDFL
jgi:sensor histidine kinase regulating citrate/malate metabolism